MPDNYELIFNLFIAQNCNLKTPILSEFKRFKQNFGDGSGRKHYITSITCEFQRKKMRKKIK